MTHRRRQVLVEIIRAAEAGEKITLASLARNCGFYDHRAAKRVLDGLRYIATE